MLIQEGWEFLLVLSHLVLFHVLLELVVGLDGMDTTLVLMLYLLGMGLEVIMEV